MRALIAYVYWNKTNCFLQPYAEDTAPSGTPLGGLSFLGGMMKNEL